MEKNILADKTALPPSMLPGAFPMLRPSMLWALQWSGPNQSLQNLMHFRYYASSMGRFMKPDNIITNIANPQSWNLYTYVNGNPVNFNDPTGHAMSGMISPSYIQGTHSFGMTWFDQFREGSAYLPWVGQTPENSWYWHVSGVGLSPAGVNYGPAAVAPQDYAQLASAAYDPYHRALPKGWVMICDPFTRPSGLTAVLFHNEETGTYVLAFAGVDEFKDVVQSGEQMALGFSLQFTEAVNIARNIINDYGSNLTLVGHSLGGGLAAAVAVELNLPTVHAFTFNAEGVNARTVGGRAVLARAGDLVKNYFKAGDWLTTIQLLTPLPNAIGTQVYCGPGGHGIAGFIVGL